MGETDYCNLPAYLPSHHYGQGYEGDEGNEEEVREQDCKGPHGQGTGVPWVQGEDRRWVDQRFFDQEQVRQNREQEVIFAGQEESLDVCRPEGKEGTGPQGLRRAQEGLSSLQEGQGVLQLNKSAWLQLGLWGYLQPWSAVASDDIRLVEHQR